MKKLIFSAVAMIAFVGSSMANTIDVENFKYKDVIEEPNWLCVSVGFAASDAVLENGGSPENAAAAATASYDRCCTIVETLQTIIKVIGK